MLSVTGLTKTFGEYPVLRDVDLRVDPGEAVAIVGPNGSGKTTLLRCIVGLDRLSAGTIQLYGEPLREYDTSARSASSPQSVGPRPAGRSTIRRLP
jgi:ABC-type Fe3+/spermidine/putrescine transport system ATPase subunit